MQYQYGVAPQVRIVAHVGEQRQLLAVGTPAAVLREQRQSGSSKRVRLQ